jgi:hypothetical protein
MRDLAAHLDRFPSMAEMHRALDKAGFYVGSIDRFRKDVRSDGIEGWLRSYPLSYRDLPKALALLGRQAPELERRVEELRRLEDEARAPLPTIGEPVVGRLSY